MPERIETKNKAGKGTRTKTLILDKNAATRHTHGFQ
jgi:hypothetical protein